MIKTCFLINIKSIDIGSHFQPQYEEISARLKQCHQYFLSDQLCAIIDWQTVHSGNPCEEIGRLLALNTTSAYRRANINQLLAFYAKKVAEFMGGNAPFTLAQLKKAFFGAMPYVMMFFCFGATNYCTMESVVGKEGTAKREENRAELFDRVRSFIEETENEFYDQIQ
ncbi:hypothetical protein niasHS_012734 [Heterodera schachtii]|uniref:Uncharacterized protein n=1 Tax=Heterodera schachtii TaxID=97005 RepID=A0ABD2INM2_HETSC